MSNNTLFCNSVIVCIIKLVLNVRYPSIHIVVYYSGISGIEWIYKGLFETIRNLINKQWVWKRLALI